MRCLELSRMQIIVILREITKSIASHEMKILLHNQTNFFFLILIFFVFDFFFFFYFSLQDFFLLKKL